MPRDQGSKGLKALSDEMRRHMPADFMDKKAQRLYEIMDAFKKSVQLDYLTGVSDFELRVAEEGDQFYRVYRDKRVERVAEERVADRLFYEAKVMRASDYREVLHLLRRELRREPLDISAVLPVALADDDRLAWVRLPFTVQDAKAIALEDLPEFADFLRRCGEGADALVLWLGSLLDPESNRSQYLHMQGEGGDGKSTLLESIRRVFGNEKVVSTSARLFNDSHFGEDLEGARLLAFPDENNPSFFSSSKFKEFTGEHGSTINPKNRAPRYIRFTHKTLAFSNNDVQITTSKADARRLISIRVESDSTDEGPDIKWWYTGLLNSGERILAYCFARYLEELERNQGIRSFIPASEAMIQEAVERKYAEVTGTLLEHYSVTGDAKDMVPRSVIHRFLAKEMGARKSDNMFISHVREACLRLGAGEKKSSIWYYTGIAERDQSAEMQKKLREKQVALKKG